MPVHSAEQSLQRVRVGGGGGGGGQARIGRDREAQRQLAARGGADGPACAPAAVFVAGSRQPCPSVEQSAQEDDLKSVSPVNELQNGLPGGQPEGMANQVQLCLPEQPTHQQRVQSQRVELHHPVAPRLKTEKPRGPATSPTTVENPNRLPDQNRSGNGGSLGLFTALSPPPASPPPPASRNSA